MTARSTFAGPSGAFRPCSQFFQRVLVDPIQRRKLGLGKPLLLAHALHFDFRRFHNRRMDVKPVQFGNNQFRIVCRHLDRNTPSFREAIHRRMCLFQSQSVRCQQAYDRDGPIDRIDGEDKLNDWESGTFGGPFLGYAPSF